MSQAVTADAAAGAAAAGEGALKRKFEEEEASGGGAKMPKLDMTAPPQTQTAAFPAATPAPTEDDAAKKPMSKAREVRLDQNRKAARESRRRKKTMIEELQRSVIFFSRANSTLKQQNDELSTLLMQTQSQIQAMESGQRPVPPTPQQTEQPVQVQAPAPVVQQPPAAAQQPAAAQPAPAPPAPAAVKAEGEQGNAFQQAQAQAVATQAVLESQVCIQIVLELILDGISIVECSTANKCTHSDTSNFCFVGFSGSCSSCCCPDHECWSKPISSSSRRSCSSASTRPWLATDAARSHYASHGFLPASCRRGHAVCHARNARHPWCQHDDLGESCRRNQSSTSVHGHDDCLCHATRRIPSGGGRSSRTASELLPRGSLYGTHDVAHPSCTWSSHANPPNANATSGTSHGSTSGPCSCSRHTATRWRCTCRSTGSGCPDCRGPRGSTTCTRS